PMKLSELREYVRVVQALLRGDTVECELEGARRKVRFLNPEAGLIDITHPIPLHLSAFAPKARSLTAEIADGWMNFVTLLPPELGPAVSAFRAQYETYAPPDARYLQLHKGHLMCVRPEEERFVTPEGELAFVIGRRCRHVPWKRAHEVIAGYLVVNDVSV